MIIGILLISIGIKLQMGFWYYLLVGIYILIKYLEYLFIFTQASKGGDI